MEGDGQGTTTDPAASRMREQMAAQPGELARVVADRAAVADVARRVASRRILLTGTGTSYHAAQQGAWLLRGAGQQAWAVAAIDAADGPFAPGRGDALIVLSHRGTKRYTTEALRLARRRGAAAVLISGIGNPDADLQTVPGETSPAFTVSHLAALARLAQVAQELGADLGDLAAVPDAVAAELAAGPTGVTAPRRLLQYAGFGINAWTAAEGALKIRETAYVASAGDNVEQIIHGPAVALGEADALVVLDGGQGSDRLADLRTIAQAQGARVDVFVRPIEPPPLSIFPLTVVVQKIAVDVAEALGTDPDSFGKDRPGHEAGWHGIAL